MTLRKQPDDIRAQLASIVDQTERRRDFALHERAATVIAQIACHEGSLPQGSPCSPVISNVVAHLLDMRLVELASTAGCTCSRYADDLTFSTNKKGYRHNVRAMAHSLVKTGAFQVLGVTQKDGQAVLEKRSGTLSELHGMLGFIDSVQVYNREQTSDCPVDEMSSSEKVYGAFPMYATLYATEAPVVVREGETDDVCLKHAIRALAADFPDLAEVMPDKSIRLGVRLYNHVRSSTARLLDLNDGGSASLSKFIALYKAVTDGFAGPEPANPMLILYDNDNGGARIRNTMKNVSGVMPTDATPFVHVTNNMYAVHTPGNAPSKIEDLFDATAKATVVAGKTFNDGSSFDRDKHYGKKVFAL